MSTIPRLVISAPSSGHGKTAVSVGLLAALSARGYRAAGFKIGPDHVDAAYLGLAAGRPGRNLDPRMVGAKRMGPLFAHGAASLDIAVVEGTMGLFDGLAGRTDSESTAQISGLLRAPVILVVDVGAMGQSVAALVHGFRAYDELLWLGGVILNRVASTRHEQLLREALDDIGVPVLGALRRHALTDAGDSGAPLPSRHHGVAPVVHHNLDAVRAVRRLGEVIAGAVDIDRTMALARSAPRLTSDPWNAEAEVAAAASGDAALASVAATRLGRRPVIGVAFAYPETAELLTAAGAEVVPFDPLRDETLPSGVDGLVIAAALPESYAEELTFNGRLRSAVAAHAAAGKPIAAEGTGLVWLCRDFNGRPMCGVVDASARETDLVVLGYREATARSSSVILPVGAQVIGHKMHRTSITPRAGLQAAWTWAGGPAEGFVQRGVHASYLGLHWAGTPSIATRFVAAAAATAPPAPGQWSTPSTSPYGRPSVPLMTFPTAPVTTAPAPGSSPAALPAAAPVTPPAPVPAVLVPAPAPPTAVPAVAAPATAVPAAPATAVPATSVPAASVSGQPAASALAASPVTSAAAAGPFAPSVVSPLGELSYVADYTTPETPAPRVPMTAIPGSILASPSGPGSIAAGSLGAESVSSPPAAPAPTVTGSYPVRGSSLMSPSAPPAGPGGSAPSETSPFAPSETDAPAPFSAAGAPGPAAGAGTSVFAPSAGAGASVSIPSVGAGPSVSTASAGADVAASTPSMGVGVAASTPSAGSGASVSTASAGASASVSVPSAGASASVSVPSAGASGSVSAPSAGASASVSVPSGAVSSSAPASSVPASAPTSPGASSPFGPALGPAMPTPWTSPSLHAVAPFPASSVSPSPASSVSAPVFSDPSLASFGPAPVPSPVSSTPSSGPADSDSAAADAEFSSPVFPGPGAAFEPATGAGGEPGPSAAPAAFEAATGVGGEPEPSAVPAAPADDLALGAGERAGLPAFGVVSDGPWSAGDDDATTVLGAADGASAGAAGVPGATDEASVGVPSGGNGPAGGAGLPSSEVVPSTVESPPPVPVQSSSPVPVQSSSSQPVSAPSVPSFVEPGASATSAAMPVSPVPVFSDAMAQATAPVSAAPGGVTAMPVAESELVGPGVDEAVGAYAASSPAGSGPAEQAPVSAPPVSGPPAGQGSAGSASIPAALVSGPVSAPPGSVVVSGSVPSLPVSGSTSDPSASTAVSAPPAPGFGPAGHTAAYASPRPSSVPSAGVTESGDGVDGQDGAGSEDSGGGRAAGRRSDGPA
ncbi:cobyrinate a,c-diamide synthase [Dactylosporangium sp. CA-233914]|uniref:cobyrinate a,c-diamide synthase n=1 Tax=Dactylosporangium sp. CA-233914 TaxID=3239934 RepID=UPI003D8AAF06